MKEISLLILIISLSFSSALGQKAKKNIKQIGKPQTTTTSVTKAKSVASSSPAISKTEQEILNELNLLRSNPSGYIQYLEEMKKSFTGKTFKNSAGTDIATNEGIVAVDDAIEFLKKQTSIPAFKASKGLTKSTSQHLQDMIKNNFFSHRGTDQSLPGDRAGLYGTANVGVIENLTEGSKSAREIVLQMLISDGLASRSQRKNLFNPEIKIVGISAGEGQKGYLCVLVLANSFEENKDSKTAKNF